MMNENRYPTNTNTQAPTQAQAPDTDTTIELLVGHIYRYAQAAKECLDNGLYYTAKYNIDQCIALDEKLDKEMEI